MLSRAVSAIKRPSAPPSPYRFRPAHHVPLWVGDGSRICKPRPHRPFPVLSCTSHRTDHLFAHFRAATSHRPRLPRSAGGDAPGSPPPRVAARRIHLSLLALDRPEPAAELVLAVSLQQPPRLGHERGHPLYPHLPPERPLLCHRLLALCGGHLLAAFRQVHRLCPIRSAPHCAHPLRVAFGAWPRPRCVAHPHALASQPLDPAVEPSAVPAVHVRPHRDGVRDLPLRLVDDELLLIERRHLLRALRAGHLLRAFGRRDQTPGMPPSPSTLSPSSSSFLLPAPPRAAGAVRVVAYHPDLAAPSAGPRLPMPGFRPGTRRRRRSRAPARAGSRCATASTARSGRRRRRCGPCRRPSPSPTPRRVSPGDRRRPCPSPRP